MVSFATGEWNPHVHAVFVIFAVLIYIWRRWWAPDFDDHDHGPVGAAIWVVIAGLAALLSRMRLKRPPTAR